MLINDLAGDPEAVDPDWHTAIGRDLGQHGADLVGGESIAQRPAGVGLELLHLAERRDHAEVENRALARRQRRVAPGLAPAILGDDALEVAVEVVDALHGAIDVSFAQHLAAHDHAAVVGLLVHGSLSLELRKCREHSIDRRRWKSDRAYRLVGGNIRARSFNWR